MGQVPKFHYYEEQLVHRAWSDTTQDGLRHDEQILKWS